MTKSKEDFFYLLFISKRKCVVYLEPANVEEELQQGENRDIQVDSVMIVSLFRVQKLSANHTEGKKRVNCYRDYLHRLKRWWSDQFCNEFWNSIFIKVVNSDCFSHLKQTNHCHYSCLHLSVDQRDAYPIIVEQEAALGSVIIQFLHLQRQFYS